LRNNLDSNIQKPREIGYAVLDYVDVYIVANDKLIFFVLRSRNYLYYFCAIPERGMTMETFISNADKALYRFKQAGRNQVTVAA